MAILSGDSASTKEEGLVRLATVAETLAGSSESIATTPYGVASYVAQIVGAAPAALNTLQELAEAIESDADFYLASRLFSLM